MKKRLKIVGWWLLAAIAILLYVIIGTVLVPVWFLVWLLTGWWYITKVGEWLENIFPNYITS